MKDSVVYSHLQFLFELNIVFKIKILSSPPKNLMMNIHHKLWYVACYFLKSVKF